MEVISILIHDSYSSFLIKKVFTPTDSGVIHSLCPALGKRHALVFKGVCPLNLQNPVGKEINVSFFLSPPFAMPAPAGGSDFLTLKLLARKFGFIPRFNLANANDGFLHNVGCILKSKTLSALSIENVDSGHQARGLSLLVSRPDHLVSQNCPTWDTRD